MNEIRGDLRDFRRATTASINAMREDFTGMREDFANLNEKFDRGFAEMRGRFDATSAGIEQILQLLNARHGEAEDR